MLSSYGSSGISTISSGSTAGRCPGCRLPELVEGLGEPVHVRRQSAHAERVAVLVAYPQHRRGEGGEGLAGGTDRVLS